VKNEDEFRRHMVNDTGCKGLNHNLIFLEAILRSRGTSLAQVMEPMKVPGSPFLKLSTRE